MSGYHLFATGQPLLLFDLLNLSFEKLDFLRLNVVQRPQLCDFFSKFLFVFQPQSFIDLGCLLCTICYILHSTGLTGPSGPERHLRDIHCTVDISRDLCFDFSLNLLFLSFLIHTLQVCFWVLLFGSPSMACFRSGTPFLVDGFDLFNGWLFLVLLLLFKYSLQWLLLLVVSCSGHRFLIVLIIIVLLPVVIVWSPHLFFIIMIVKVDTRLTEALCLNVNRLTIGLMHVLLKQAHIQVFTVNRSRSGNWLVLLLLGMLRIWVLRDWKRRHWVIRSRGTIRARHVHHRRRLHAGVMWNWWRWVVEIRWIHIGIPGLRKWRLIFL